MNSYIAKFKMKCHGHVKRIVTILVVILFVSMFVVYGLLGPRTNAAMYHGSYKDTPEWRQTFNARNEMHVYNNTINGTMQTPSWLHDLLKSNESLAAIHRKRMAESVMKVRLLCVILTMEKDLYTKVAAVNKTWVTRCDKHLYIITSKQNRHDFLNMDLPDLRNNLAQKMKKVFIAIYKQYMDDFDYVLKCDDDTYVIVENLKYLLWHYDSNKPSYLGYHFNKFVQSGYMSGGAGYVISNRGVRQLVERGFQDGVCKLEIHADDPENSEDIETGRCLETVGVPPLNSLDAKGRETFHPYTLERHLHGNLPGYIYSWAKHPIQKGEECCSRYTISFHYVNPDAIYYLDHVLYKMTVFGLNRDIDYGKPQFNPDNVLFER